MPNFMKFGGSRADRQYDEIYTSRTFFIFFLGESLGSSTEISTEQFQALNGLKCSTVGNLGSYPSSTQILVQYWCHIFPILNVVVTFANFRQHITDIRPILSNWCLPILAIQYSPNIL